MGKFRYLFAALAVFLAACSDDSKDASKAKAEKRTLTIARSADMTTFDPQNSFNSPTDMVFANMFSHLYMRDVDNATVPNLAESMEAVSDTLWRLKLKDGIKFHNGDPLTSEDVKFTFERVSTDESLAVQPYYRAIKAVNVIDDRTFEIETDGPLPTLQALMTFSGSWILPKKYIEEKGWENFLKNPVGSGPYKFKQWIRDDRVVLEPFDDYFDGKVEAWDEVVFRAIPESSTRVAELLTGGVDLALDIPPNEWGRIEGNEGTSLARRETSRVAVLIVRLTEGSVTADPKVREAIELAINGDEIAESLYRGAATPTRTRITPGVFGSQEKLHGQNLYDPERAKALLAEAGYPDGVELTLNAGRGRFLLDGEAAEMIAGMLREAGFKVNLDLDEWSEFLNVYRSKSNKELLLIGLGDSLYDASDSLLHYTYERAKGQTDYRNEETHNLFFAAGKNMNVDERRAQYQRIQDVVAEERPHIPVFQLKSVYGVSDKISFKPYLKEVVIAASIKPKEASK